MSFHAGQTFTFGEQPSATKWQYLWDNDYALADGTGISNDAIINRHVLNSTIKGVKLDWSSITLGVVKATAGLTNVGSETLVPGLTLAVTVPSGLPATAWLRIELDFSLVYNNTTGGFARANIWEGAVGSGTQLWMGQNKTPAATGAAPTDNALTVVYWEQNPTAGARTFRGSVGPGGTGAANVGWSNTAGLKYGAFMSAEIR